MTTEQMIKHIRKIIWDLSGEKELQAERILTKLYKRRDRAARDLPTKTVESFNALSFIDAIKEGYIYQLVDGDWCYDSSRYGTASEALKALNDHLSRTCA